ncbi:UDP-glycosyltransferase 83A1 [Quillaja saponaria]|uniref:UDP-glycosyltransferase 83A1 n=1 Tax=Quillaja saponaria TaxID=32244 RepID=A0AAD7Q3S0_QUISA|nr:UDP-glycosyltransferase 83A1 [Quillaja saponaria]
MPVMETAHFAWSCIGDTTSQKIIFDYFVGLLQTWTIAGWWLCNTTYQLEPEALALSPNLLPVGPLMETYHNRELALGLELTGKPFLWVVRRGTDNSVGFGLDPDQKGIISREEIKKKVEQLLGVENLKARSSKLKEMAMNNIAEGGQSSENFEMFIKWLKE